MRDVLAPLYTDWFIFGVCLRVSGCSGRQGCLLTSPKLMYSEGNEEIEKQLDEVLAHRRVAFGEVGCPTALTTDNIRRDHVMMKRLLQKHFPVAYAYWRECSAALPRLCPSSLVVLTRVEALASGPRCCKPGYSAHLRPIYVCLSYTALLLHLC